MSDPLIVAPVFEARRQLSQVLARFREEGAAAEPVILGSHRQPEAVLLSYERYRAMVDQGDGGRAERARAEAVALASVRAEGLEPSALGHKLMAQVIDGEVTSAAAIQQLIKHHRRV